jgi:hypothetical protein
MLPSAFMQPRRVLLVATSFVLALAIWVSRGALGVVDAGSWPGRVGILPSRWAPPVLAIVLVGALWRARRETLLALLIPGVLLLPWLPLPVPAAALIWTDHVAAWVWFATAIAVLVVTWPRWAPSRIVRELGDPYRGSLIAMALAFALFWSASWMVAKVLPGGDEPHYLVITQSLLRDGDLQIENNHTRGDYAEYFNGPLKPDFLRRGTNGAIYSIHAPGLPALVLPVFAVAGYRGVVAFLSLLSALGTWLVWRAAYRVTGSAGAAWFGWASTTVSVPFFIHSFTVYPDATGATIVMAGVTALIACEATVPAGQSAATTTWSVARWAAIGALVSALPWLHTRYAGAAAVLCAFVVARLAGLRAFSRIAAFLALPLVSAAAWLGFFYAIYGEFSPAAPYNHYTQSALGNIPWGLAGLLFDQQFGLLPNGPACLIGVLGLGSLFRARRRLAVEIAVLFTSYLLLVTAYHMWWGGWSAPARFAVPVLLMLGLPAAAFWSRQRAAGKALALAALGTSALVTGTMVFVNSGRLIFNTRDGFALWLDWLTPVVDLPRALPSFFRESLGTALAQSAIWVVCLGVGAWIVHGLVRRTDAEPEGRLGAVALRMFLVFAVAAMVAASATWATGHVAGPTPSTSALAVLRAYDPAERAVGVGFDPFGRVSIDRVPSRLLLSVSNRRPTDPAGPMLVLLDVPAGVYRLAPAVALAAQGTAVVTIGRSTQPIARWTFDPAARGASYQFTLPVGVTAVVVSGDALARRTMARVAIEPVSVAPEVWRFTMPRAERAARYDDLVAFAFEPDAWLEDNGLWVPGDTPCPLVFAGPDGEPMVRFLVRNCPVENRVTLRGATRTDVLDMKPGEVRVVEMPVDRMNRGTLVEVTAARGYRPAEVDHTTQDRRYLGVWIQNAPGQR